MNDLIAFLTDEAVLNAASKIGGLVGGLYLAVCTLCRAAILARAGIRYALTPAPEAPLSPVASALMGRIRVAATDKDGDWLECGKTKIREGIVLFDGKNVPLDATESKAVATAYRARIAAIKEADRVARRASITGEAANLGN